MTLEVLVSAVNADIDELIKRIRINSDAIIINQCDKNAYEEKILNSFLVRVYHFKERGVGLSRNNALLRAKADIVLFVDEDETLVENYREIIINEFEKNKNAEMMFFNINTINTDRKTYEIKRNRRVHKYNCLRYGAARLAVRLSVIRANRISFSLLFGGGALYGSGEDSLFIYDSLKKKIRAYSNSYCIATVNQKESSWFTGYHSKFFFDKGALLYSLHGHMAIFFTLIFLLRHREFYEKIGFKQALISMRLGIKDIKVGVKNENDFRKKK